ncbi:hypothetical protein OSCT_2501 [Oscillochloris trichoides DG-6]|uniref:Transmembrane anti-sigma factor n=1 Tax=Oscillochloris trichoides DG-6 TaxID=765420 RepID=E1IGQ0_9CHLR|nr:hypothetical protein [Oscillochloris trichoides]EFO79637.1 hypothetical protein OSCT_2501 [Oscillochloris trichoides DG-6]
MKTPQPQFSPLPEQDLELLSAYLDDQLEGPTRSDLERRLADDPRLRSELEELRSTTALLRELPTLTPPRSFTLDPATVQPRRSHYAGWALAWVGQLGSGLAGLMLVLLASLQMLGGMSGPMAAAPAPMIAQPTASALYEAAPAATESAAVMSVPIEATPSATESAAVMSVPIEATVSPDAAAGTMALPANSEPVTETESAAMMTLPTEPMVNSDMARQTEPSEVATPEVAMGKAAPAPAGVPPVVLLLLGLVLLGVAGASWVYTRRGA